MNPNDPALLSALQSSRLAADLSVELRTVLSGVVRMLCCPAGTVLAREGVADEHVYAVVEGTLGVVTAHGTPEAAPVATLGPGDLSHELGFLDGGVRHATLVATGDARVLALARSGLESLLDSHPRVVWGVVCAIARVVHRRQTQLTLQRAELTNYVVKQHGRY